MAHKYMQLCATYAEYFLWHLGTFLGSPDGLPRAVVREQCEAMQRQARRKPCVPHTCQFGRSVTVSSGHSRTSRTAFDLRTGRLTRCVKHTSKQPVNGRWLCVAGQPHWDQGHACSTPAPGRSPDDAVGRE